MVAEIETPKAKLLKIIFADNSLPADQSVDAVAEDFLSKLTPREREVMELRFGIKGDYERSLDEVGRCYGITRERVRQIETRVLVKLKARVVRLRIKAEADAVLDPNILQKEVSQMNFSCRAITVFRREGIVTLGDLLIRTPESLQNLRNFTETSIQETRERLSALGFKLRFDN